ncbi:hypothetical protein [Rhodohalobacter mucosus]|uniref:Uncharacterized protein n=1 Tax=Rhodohalobacter mucosus TaxID=2079485 RepID=A0A316TVX3_9BACT|nr:hypothetical protein [Rhodohalobacter mucosus]PWN06682.1 hypothetical protein DDZ15_09205 [Rhodohalobacter mucosus]
MTLRRLSIFLIALAFPFAMMSCSDSSTGAVDDGGDDGGDGGDNGGGVTEVIEFPITFEKDITYADFISDFNGGELTVVDNPDPSGDNTSDKVAQMVKKGDVEDAQPWGGSVLLLEDNIDFAGGTQFTVSVWAPRPDTKMLFKIENEENPEQAFEREITIAESQQWVDVSFDLSGADQSNAYKKLVFIFDLGTLGDGTSDFTWYFDNIRQEEGDGGGGDPPAEPVDPAPTPAEDEANVISLFSDAYTDVAVDTWRTDWSAGDLEDIDIQGNATKKYTNLNFVGIETTGDNLVDASTMTHFHIDVWTPNMDVVRVKLVDFGPDGAFEGGDDSEHEIVFDTLPQEQWNTLKIPMSDFTGLQNQSNIAQYVLSGTPAGEGILYVDNFYFSDDGSGGGGGGDIVELPLTFEQDITWADAITNFEGGDLTVVDNPDQTGNTSAKVAQMIKGAGATFAGSIITLTDNINFADGTDFTVSVWAPRPNTTMLFKIENETDAGQFFEQELTIAESQQWVDITFDMSGANQSNTYKKLIFIFDNGTAGDGTADYTWYFDNLEQSAGNGGGGGDALALPVTFDDTSLDYGLTDFGGNQSEIVADPTDGTNNVAQSTKTASAELWAGTTVGGDAGFGDPIPFTSGATTMSVRVWSPDAGIPIRLKVEDSTDPTISVETEAVTTVASQWETLVFDFSNEASGTAALNLANSYNKASIFFNFGTTGADAGEKTYYWDDMEFGDGQ